MNLPLTNGWGEKHRFFVKWKYIEAKVPRDTLLCPLVNATIEHPSCVCPQIPFLFLVKTSKVKIVKVYVYIYIRVFDIYHQSLKKKKVKIFATGIM